MYFEIFSPVMHKDIVLTVSCHSVTANLQVRDKLISPGARFSKVLKNFRGP